MTHTFSAILQQRLAALDEHSLRRALKPRAGIDFASNDYLGFAADPELGRRFFEAVKQLPVGAAGSRLLRGEMELHARVEAELADFSSQPAALLFPSGYQANVGLLTALLRPGDTVFSDALNHASIIDGVRLSGANKIIYPHADAAALRALLAEQRAAPGFKLIVTESLFSMDGDRAPLQELAAPAAEFGAALVVDEAHATGLYGDFAGGRGGGLAQEAGLSDQVLATVHTGGKALGAGGAWVAGSAELKEYLVNFSRPFIFSTAVIPALAALLECSVNYWREVGPARARQTLARAAEFRAALQDALAPQLTHSAVEIPNGDGPILPVIFGGNEKTLAVAAALQTAGYDARAIRPPTVPEGSARLRLTVTGELDEAEIHGFVAALKDCVGS